MSDIQVSAVADSVGNPPAASPRGMVNAAYLSHLAQHFYIGAAPLLFPLIMTDLGLSFAVIGAVVAVRTFCAGFFQVFYGHLAARFSRRTIMNGSNVVSVLSSIGMGLSGAFAPFLAFNVLWGLSTSPVHPIGGTLIGDGKDARKGIDLGLFYSYAYVGNLIGAILVTVLVGRLGWQGILVLLGVLTVPVLLYGLSVGDPASAPATAAKPATHLMLTALGDRKVLLTCLVGLFFFGGTNVFIRHLVPLYLTAQFHLPLEQASLVFIALSMIGIGAPPVFGRIAGRYGHKNVLVVLAGALAATFAVLAGHGEFDAVAVVLLAVAALLAWPLLALLHGFLVGVLDHEVKGAGGDLLLTVNICSFILWGALFGHLVDISGSFDWTLAAIGGLCLASVPLLLAVPTRQSQSVATSA